MADPTMNPVADPRSEAWNRAVYAFGTARIFGARAKGLRRGVQLVTYFGLWPVVVTGMVAAGGGISQALPMLLPAMAIVSLVQACVSLWLIVARADDNLGYAVESLTENSRLSTAFERLARSWPSDAETRLSALVIEDDGRRLQDEKHHITDVERRYGMRESLFKFQRKCICGQVPDPRNPKSNCSACGK